MNIRRNYTSYGTFYEIIAENNLPNVKLSDRNACFSDFFHGYDNREVHDFHVKIKIWTDDSFLQSKGDNLSYLTHEELIWYLEELKKVVPFTFTFESANEGKSIVVIFDTKCQAFELKWLLTCIRYTYEGNYAASLKDAVVLKMNKLFKNVNVLNVFNITAKCYMNFNYYAVNHAVANISRDYSPKFINYIKLQELLKQKDRLNDIYPQVKAVAYNYIEEKDDKDSQEFFTLENLLERYEKYFNPLYKALKETNNYILK